jgi:hypothetical protein
VAPQRDRILERVRKICLALPGAEEKEGAHRPTFQVRKKTFVMYMDDHHGDGRLALWYKAAPGVQGELVTSEPQRFFVPPYAGPQGWVGLLLTVDLDWDEVTALAEDAYRLQAPMRLLRQLDGEA